MSDPNHKHRWQPGPLIQGWSPAYTGRTSAPTTIVLVCQCGELWRKPVPNHKYDEPA